VIKQRTGTGRKTKTEKGSIKTTSKLCLLGSVVDLDPVDR
jgi:hypothetical protein